MRIGPFEPRDAEAVEKLFESHRIQYEIAADAKLRDNLLQEYNEKLRLGPSLFTGSLDLRYIYFILSDDDCQKISKELEPFGIKV